MLFDQNKKYARFKYKAVKLVILDKASLAI